MKIKIELDENIEEDEILIRCRSLNEEIYRLQKLLSDEMAKKPQLLFYRGKTEYYISLDQIIFFETFDGIIQGHTREELYDVKYKLYELEEILPRNFVRVSKSTILNIDHISSITRNIASASVVEFRDTYKNTYISRHYYGNLKTRLEEERGYEK